MTECMMWGVDPKLGYEKAIKEAKKYYEGKYPEKPNWAGVPTGIEVPKEMDGLRTEQVPQILMYTVWIGVKDDNS